MHKHWKLHQPLDCNQCYCIAWCAIFIICKNKQSIHCYLMTQYHDRGFGYHWLRWLLVAYATPCHHLNQCWRLAALILCTKIKWHLNENAVISIPQIDIENVVCKVWPILSRCQCVKDDDILLCADQTIGNPHILTEKLISNHLQLHTHILNIAYMFTTNIYGWFIEVSILKHKNSLKRTMYATYLFVLLRFKLDAPKRYFLFISFGENVGYQ